MLNVPDELKKVAEELKIESAKKDELLSMKSLNEKIKSFKEKDKPQIEQRIADIETVSGGDNVVRQKTISLLIFSSFNDNDLLNINHRHDD